MANPNPAPQGGYEKTDAEAKPLILFTVGLFLICAITFVAMAIVFKGLEMFENAQDKPSVTIRDERWRAPDIQLEVHPSFQREAFQKLEQEHLTHYAWVDPSAGKVRVPIKRAMELLLAKGLPSREASSFEDEGSPSLTESGGKKTSVQ